MARKTTTANTPWRQPAATAMGGTAAAISMAPAGTPRPIIDRVHRIILAAMDTPELKQQFAAQGLEPVGMGPDEFQAFMKVDLQRWREVIASTGIKGQ